MKSKYIFLGIILTLFSIVIISILSINSKLNRTIYIKDINKYGEKITILKKKINKLEDGQCKNDLRKLLDKINQTHFNENTTLKKYYLAYYKENTFLEIINVLKESCELSDTFYDEIYIDVLSSTIYPESIKKEYAQVYEINFIDSSEHQKYNKQFDNIGTYTNKTKELNVLKNILEEIK